MATDPSFDVLWECPLCFGISNPFQDHECPEVLNDTDDFASEILSLSPRTNNWPEVLCDAGDFAAVYSDLDVVSGYCDRIKDILENPIGHNSSAAVILHYPVGSCSDCTFNVVDAGSDEEIDTSVPTVVADTTPEPSPNIFSTGASSSGVITPVGELITPVGELITPVAITVFPCEVIASNKRRA